MKVVGLPKSISVDEMCEGKLDDEQLPVMNSKLVGRNFFTYPTSFPPDVFIVWLMRQAQPRGLGTGSSFPSFVVNNPNVT